MDPPLPRHGIVLRDGDLVLRPMTERDWPLLARWHRRTEVLRWTEGDPQAGPWTLEQVQHMYRSVAQAAACFIMKWRGAEIGECWLQRMNLPDVLSRYPGQDLRRIDIAIFRPQLWSRGIGRRAIALLADYGLDRDGADAIVAVVHADNARSRRAFTVSGFSFDHTFAGDGPAAELRLILRRNAARA
jgi:RimJ/RimL family protein N-acetyltransferase